MSKWAKLLQEHLDTSSEAPTDDWKTVNQISAEINRSETTGRFLVRKLFKKKKLERKKFMLQRADAIIPVWHYKVI